MLSLARLPLGMTLYIQVILVHNTESIKSHINPVTSAEPWEVSAVPVRIPSALSRPLDVSLGASEGPVCDRDKYSRDPTSSRRLSLSEMEQN